MPLCMNPQCPVNHTEVQLRHIAVLQQIAHLGVDIEDQVAHKPTWRVLQDDLIAIRTAVDNLTDVALRLEGEKADA